MQSSVADTDTIRALAARLRKLKPRDSDQIALVGFMVGVLYSLDRAVTFRFADERMKLDAVVECAEQQRILEALENASALEAPWLAGFYLDSALMRLAALDERIRKYLGSNRNAAPKIRRIVNQIKHDIDAGIRSGWTIGFRDVLEATEDLCTQLEKAIV